MNTNKLIKFLERFREERESVLDPAEYYFLGYIIDDLTAKDIGSAITRLRDVIEATRTEKLGIILDDQILRALLVKVEKLERGQVPSNVALEIIPLEKNEYTEGEVIKLKARARNLPRNAEYQWYDETSETFLLDAPETATEEIENHIAGLSIGEHKIWIAILNLFPNESEEAKKHKWAGPITIRILSHERKSVLGGAFEQYAIAVYQALLRGEQVGQQPIYLSFTRDFFEVSEHAPLFEETQNTESAFIGIKRDENHALLFPNPNISIYEPTSLYDSHLSLVFNELTPSNWETQKLRIIPKPIKKRHDGLWEVVQAPQSRIVQTKRQDTTETVGQTSELVRIDVMGFAGVEKKVGFLEGKLGSVESWNDKKFQRFLVRRIIIDTQATIEKTLRIAERIGIKEVVQKALDESRIGEPNLKINLDYGELWPDSGIPGVASWDGDKKYYKQPINFSEKIFPQNVPLLFKTVKVDREPPFPLIIEGVGEEIGGLLGSVGGVVASQTPNILVEELATNPKYKHGVYEYRDFISELEHGAKYVGITDNELMRSMDIFACSIKDYERGANLRSFFINIPNLRDNSLKEPFSARIVGDYTKFGRINDSFVIRMVFRDEALGAEGNIRYVLLIPPEESSRIKPLVKSDPSIVIRVFQQVFPEYDRSGGRLKIDQSNPFPYFT